MSQVVGGGRTGSSSAAKQNPLLVLEPLAASKCIHLEGFACMLTDDLISKPLPNPAVPPGLTNRLASQSDCQTFVVIDLVSLVELL